MRQQTPLLTKLANDELSTNEFERILSEWRDYADETKDSVLSQEINASKNLIQSIEKKAALALHRLVDAPEQGQNQFQTNSQFLGFSCGALLVDRTGHIIQANDQAIRQFEIDDEDTLDALRWTAGDGRPLPEAMKADRNNLQNATQFSLIKVVQSKTGRDLNLALLHLGQEKQLDSRTLIVSVDAPWTTQTSELVSSKFGLTNAECDIASDFAQGKSLRGISEARGKSYTTVRNQFQSVLEKTGCTNQVELLRLLLGTSHLLAQLDILLPPAKEQHTRDVNLIRPNKRFFDVTLIGDFSGTPFLFLPSVFGHSVTPHIEKLLVDKSLLMMSVMRPGFGGSSPPSKDQSEDECLAQDVEAFLDDMGIEMCPIMGRASSARSACHLLRRLSDRLQAGYLVNAVVPRKYVKRDSIRSKWTQTLFSAASRAPGVASLILGAGGKILLRSGTERFIRRMYANSPIDQKIVGDPDVAKSIRDGVIMTIEQGPEAGIRDMIKSFGDWSDLANEVQAPITLLHGTKDPHVPIEAVRGFVAEVPRKRELMEFDAGGLLNYSHAERIFDKLIADLAAHQGAK